MSRLLGLSVAALALAAAAFWAMSVTGPHTTEAETMARFDVNEALTSAPEHAPIQEAGVIACTYVLTDGYRCL